MSGVMQSSVPGGWNTFSRPLAWNPLAPGFVAPGGGSLWLVKPLTEFKTGENGLVDHNLYQYSWAGQQTGQAFIFNQAIYGQTFQRIRNFTVTNNVIDSVAIAFELAVNTETGVPSAAQLPAN